MTVPTWQSLQGDRLLDEIPHGVVVIDRDLRIVRCNHAFEEVFGPSRDKHCYEVYKDRADECEDCPTRATFADGRQRVLEESGLDLHGQTVHYMAQLTPLADADDEITHVAAITTDLTTTKRLQREYQTLFEKVPCYVTVLNRDRRVVKANEMFRRTFGEPRGEYCYRLFKHQHRECEDCPAARTFADGGSYTSRHVGTSRDGTPTHYVVSTAPLLWGDGDITHVIEMALDVTTTTEMEAELFRASAFRKALVENSLDAIVVTDENQQVVLMNRAAEELWRADRADLIGKKVPPQILPKQLQQAGGPGDDSVLLHETTITSLDGETIPVRLAGINLHQDGKLLGGAVIAQDRREVKELEREKITAERLAAVGQTVAGLAHGIKNVLMGIDGGMYAFRSGMRNGDNERMLKGWQMLEENIERISTFVKEFLEFARGRKPEVKLVDPNLIAQKVVDLFRDKAAMSGITLDAELQEGIPYALMDEGGIQSCLDNLVSNALDACEICDRKDRRVVVRTREGEGALVIEVADNGSGIDYDIHKKVFTTFFSTKGANKGTGLGLLTTRKIVQQHGGKVSFESTVGEGSVFRLEFPRDRLPSLDDDEAA
ncbi:PAS domain-containing protein [bacterium]|nr:PAS domain-containing protein [bacterium]MBU1674610.1 PAS domain-containing protein [bacterium]